MNTAPPSILILNGGSSSIKFALYEATSPLKPVVRGKIDRIGLTGTTLSLSDSPEKPSEPLPTGDFNAAANFLVDWLVGQNAFVSLRAVGHRVVHGLKHSEPERVTPALLEELRRITPYDPEHLPLEILLMEIIARRFPSILQIACFDTAFHRSMPRVAKMLPIPRRYEAKGMERYGFHGLSYAYVMEELARLGDPAAGKGRVILAHLGNGASLCAVRDGKSVDTSMGFTPNSGIMMSTRSGDLEPGLIHYLMLEEHLTPAQVHEQANQESGLRGVSETSPDIRDLLAAEAVDIRAAEAVDLFCYQVKKGIGAYAAALGGLDAVVFTGGIGENSAPVRERICNGLGFFGIHLDPQRNAENAPVISEAGGKVRVRVLHTDEELMIARSCAALLEADR